MFAFPVRRRALTAATTLVTASLAVSLLALPRASADEPNLRDHVRGRAGHAIAHAQELNAAARDRSGKPAPRSALPGATPGTALREAGDPPYCDGARLASDAFADRVEVYVYNAGAASFEVQRRRMYGTWQRVFTAQGNHGTFTDRSISTVTNFSYRLLAKNAAGAVVSDCISYDQGMYTENGNFPYVDFAAGTPEALAWVPKYDSVGPFGFFGTRGVPGFHMTPAFSADGRLVAATEINQETGAGRLVVRQVNTSAVVWTLDLGGDITPADAAFSPDGQTLAFTRYETQSGVSLGLAFTDVHGSHAVRLHPSTRALAEPAWRPDSSGIVATDLAEDAGLVSTCATCSSVSAIAGTTFGYTPEVAPDGTLRFALTDERSSRIVKHSSAGVSTLVSGSADEVLSHPRLSPDGQLHFLVDDYATATEWTVFGRIKTLTLEGYVEDLRFGAMANVFGFDVRQPSSKGTSDVTGAPDHDVIARDTQGVLWAYPTGNVGMGARVRLGGGWNAFTRVLAAGDLTSDGRADLLATDSLGKLWLWKGTGRGSFTPKVQIGSGWSSGYTLVTPGDLTGDQRADLVARDSAGALWLYAGTGRGTVGSRVLMGSGWNNQNLMLGSGDVNFDNRADLISRDRLGRLWLWPGDGRSRLGTARQIGSGWVRFTAITVTEVVNQRPKIWARTSSGTLGFYDMYADGAISPNGYYALGGGWNAMTVLTS